MPNDVQGPTIPNLRLQGTRLRLDPALGPGGIVRDGPGAVSPRRAPGDLKIYRCRRAACGLGCRCLRSSLPGVRLADGSLALQTGHGPGGRSKHWAPDIWTVQPAGDEIQDPKSLITY